jgi:aldose 1-epimerase
MNIEMLGDKASGFVKLTNRLGFSVTLCDYGAAIYEIRYGDDPLCIAEADKNAFLNSSAYFGKTVGRIAGRIPSAKIKIAGKEYALEANEGVNTLHGGFSGFSFKKWKLEITDVNGDTAADFYYTSPAGEGGFPGEVRVRVRYLVKEDAPLVGIYYEYATDAATPLNLPCHAYFNLGGFPTIEDHLLSIESAKTAIYDEQLIPQGFRHSPAALDFRVPKRIGKDLYDPSLQKSRAAGYDHCFLFDGTSHEKALLRFESPKYTLELLTSYPAVQVYSDNYPRKNSLLNTGLLEVLHSGLALEPVFRPADIAGMMCYPGALYHQSIVYRFRKKEERK